MSRKNNCRKNGSNVPRKKFDNSGKNKAGPSQKRTVKRTEKTPELAYRYFFDSKNNKGIVLYDEFPNMDQIYDYYKENNFAILHPLYEYGNFEIKELAEIIKFIYSIKCQSDYQVITTGTLTENVSVLLDGEVRDIIPNLYFLVGNDKSLDFWLPYNGLFLEDGSKILLPNQPTNSMISLSPNTSIVNDTLGMITSCSDSSIEKNGIVYYNYLQEKFENVKYLSTINIFESDFMKIIRGYSGIQDTLSFLIHSNDEFLAKVLLSIVIYKKNNNKLKLSNDDYSYIFKKLFNENVNIRKEIERGIPKKLKYVSRNG